MTWPDGCPRLRQLLGMCEETDMIHLLINLIIWLLVIGILYWLVIYVLDAVPIPQPANRVIKIALTVLCVLVIIGVLLNILGVDTGLPTGVAPRP